MRRKVIILKTWDKYPQEGSDCWNMINFKLSIQTEIINIDTLRISIDYGKDDWEHAEREITGSEEETEEGGNRNKIKRIKEDIQYV